MRDFRGSTYKQICAALGVENLRGANLYWANLRGTDLRGADFYGTDLRGADLRWANFYGANFRGTDLRWANFYGADFRGADFYGANLEGADFRWADFEGASFYGADLRGADFRGAKNIPDMPWLVIAGEGELIVYKKVSNGIAKLLIPADAERSNATTRKCRASKAIVLECPEGAVSLHDSNFKYKAGGTVVPDQWCSDRWNECAGGIHFFLTRAEAEAYF